MYLPPPCLVLTGILPLFISQRIHDDVPTFLVVYSTCNLGLFSTLLPFV